MCVFILGCYKWNISINKRVMIYSHLPMHVYLTCVVIWSYIEKEFCYFNPDNIYITTCSIVYIRSLGFFLLILWTRFGWIQFVCNDDSKRQEYQHCRIIEMHSVDNYVWVRTCTWLELEHKSVILTRMSWLNFKPTFNLWLIQGFFLYFHIDEWLRWINQYIVWIMVEMLCLCITWPD